MKSIVFKEKDFSSWSIYQGFSEGSGRSEKQWLQSSDGRIGLFKWPKIDPQTEKETYEYISEHLAHQLGEVLGIPTARVDIGMYDSRIGSFSYLVNKPNEELREGAWFILGRHPRYDVDNLVDSECGKYYSVELIFEISEDQKMRLFWLNMMFFDFLIGNSDRHQNNWAFLLPIEDKGEDIIRMRPCPLYDNGSSLCCYINDLQIQEYLGNDTNRIKALIDTKSRSAIRIDSQQKKTPTHADVIRYLLEKYPESDGIATGIIERLPKTKIEELLGRYPESLLPGLRKQLLSVFLNGKVELLKALKDEVSGNEA